MEVVHSASARQAVLSQKKELAALHYHSFCAAVVEASTRLPLPLFSPPRHFLRRNQLLVCVNVEPTNRPLGRYTYYLQTLLCFVKRFFGISNIRSEQLAFFLLGIKGIKRIEFAQTPPSSCTPCHTLAVTARMSQPRDWSFPKTRS